MEGESRGTRHILSAANKHNDLLQPLLMAANFSRCNSLDLRLGFLSAVAATPPLSASLPALAGF